MRCTVLATAILIAAIGPANAQQLWRSAGEETLDQATLIAPAQFSIEHVLDLSKAFVKANAGYKVLRYFIATDRMDAFEKLKGPGVTDIDFPDWLRRYKLQSPRTPATAELIKVRDQAIVRFRSANGQITQRITGAGDPLLIDFHGETVKVLEISPIPPGLVMRQPYIGGAHFFVQTSRPWTLALAHDFTKSVREMTGLMNVVVSIEDGWWFAGDPVYPVYNRFLPYMEPPTFEEFKKHTRFYCEDLPGGCLQTGPARGVSQF